MGSEYILAPNGELYHWGIRGMKWGIRRYQNKDGSLTPLGKKRYDSEMTKLKERERTIKERERTKAKLAKLEAKKVELDAREAALAPPAKSVKNKPAKVSDSNRKKSIKDMSDEELNAAINRAKLENTYKTLYPEKVPFMKTFMSKFVSDAVVPAAVNSGKKFIQDALDKNIDKMFKDAVDPNSLAELKKTKERLEVESAIKKLRNGGDGMSWDDRLKQQDYERKRKDAELDDLKRMNNLETERKRAQDLQNKALEELERERRKLEDED